MITECRTRATTIESGEKKKDQASRRRVLEFFSLTTTRRSVGSLSMTIQKFSARLIRCSCPSNLPGKTSPNRRATNFCTHICETSRIILRPEPNPFNSLTARKIFLRGPDTKHCRHRNTWVKGVPMPVSASCRNSCSFCWLLFSVALAFVCLVVPSSAFAQTELAGVYGRVTDPSGAVIVDAEVEIKNVETNVSTTVKTNADGLYNVPSLHPGHYLISVRKVGFKSVTDRNQI